MSRYLLFFYRFILVVSMLLIAALCVVTILVAFDLENIKKWTNVSLAGGALVWMTLFVASYRDARKDLDQYNSSAEDAEEVRIKIKEGFGMAMFLLVIAVLVCLGNINPTLRGFATHANAVIAFFICFTIPFVTKEIWTPVFEEEEKISQKY